MKVKVQNNGPRAGLESMLQSNGVDRITFNLGIRWSWLVKFISYRNDQQDATV